MMDAKKKKDMLVVVGIIAVAGLILWYLRHVQPDGSIQPAVDNEALPAVESQGFTPQTYTPGTFDVPALTTNGFTPSSPVMAAPSAPVPIVNVTTGTPNPYGSTTGLVGPDGGASSGNCGCNNGPGTGTVSFGSTAAQAAYVGGLTQSSTSGFGPVSPVQNLAQTVSSGLNAAANFVINLVTPPAPTTTVQPIIVRPQSVQAPPTFTPGAGYNDPVDAPFKNLLVYPN